MAKYTIKAGGKIMTLSSQKIKQYLKDNPKHEVGTNPFGNMPVSLHNLIAEHNSKVKQ